MRNSIVIEEKHLEIVCSILTKYLQSSVKVYVFGSRVKGNVKRFSDLDLALQADYKIDMKTLADLEYAFEESLLPYKVDVLDINAIDVNFKKIIDKDKMEMRYR